MGHFLFPPSIINLENLHNLLRHFRDRKQSAVFRAFNLIPAEIVDAVTRRLLAILQIFQILLMDILLPFITLISLRHKSLADFRINREKDDLIRSRNAHKPVFKIHQPVQVLLPFLTRELCTLVNGVGSTVPIADNDSTALIELLPLRFIAGEAIDSIKRGSSIGIYISGAFAYLTCKVHFNKHGGRLIVIRKTDRLVRNAFLPIDEIETSQHPKLLEMMLFEYLKTHSRSQLLVTTHNDGLLDLVDDLIRKDSVWFTEKDKAGVTDLYKLTDFRGVNRLSSIREAYRNKRFGATMK